MSKIRSEDTSPELIIRKFLSNKGYRYRLYNKKLPGKPDIVFTSKKTVIFVNGCFWHQHKNCRRKTVPKSNLEYWLPKLERNILNQKQQIKTLKKAGWKTSVIWECETKMEQYLRQKLGKIINL